MEQAEFREPWLVAVYDAEYGWSRDDEFFLSIANETPRVRVLDLGCGTGRLTLALASAGHQVTGLDPATASLTAARAKPRAEDVEWREGAAASLPDGVFDLALMTSHVARFFVDDTEWAATLRDIHRALVPGARLTFDSRDPRARAWERWNREKARRTVTLPDRTTVDVWTEVSAVDGNVVRVAREYRFDDGTRLRSTAALRFRTEDDLRVSLGEAGFSIEAVYGGWERQPVGAPDGEILVVARR